MCRALSRWALWVGLGVLAVGCLDRQPVRPGQGWPDRVGEDGMWGFTWIEPAGLAMSPRPTPADLHWMGAEGIDLLVTATEAPLDPAALSAAGLGSLHLPIVDFQAPTLDQILSYTQAVQTERDAGRAVAVHCLAGRGRSGTLAALWLVHQGAAPDQAIDRVRDLRPGAIESLVQEQVIADYAAWLDGSPWPSP